MLIRTQTLQRKKIKQIGSKSYHSRKPKDIFISRPFIGPRCNFDIKILRKLWQFNNQTASV